jgi:hypothetical protein
MIICPWCGTNYLSFQSNCKNCGGPLQMGDQASTASSLSESLPTPPAAPRPVSDRYVWHLLSSDGWMIAALVLGILGFVFSLVGTGLTLGVITAFVGIPFLFIGVGMLGSGAGILIWRYQAARKLVTVLQIGEAALGQIVDLNENYSVTVNGRHPWVVRYQFRSAGQDYLGSVTTLNQPGQTLQPGKDVYVLYLATAPQWSSIYPHP